MPRTANEEPGRSRILLREFRKRRQPKRCDSLPCLQIVPASRQLYVCHRCSFTNTICKICPWCLSACDVAAQVAVSLVRRRLSSPMLLSDAQKMQLAKIERATNSRLPAAVLSPTAARSGHSHTRGGSALPHGAETPSAASPRPTRGSRGLPDDAPVAEADDPRRRHRNVRLYSATDVVATVSEDSTLQPFLDQIAAARSEGRPITTPEPLFTTPPLSARTSLDSPSPTSRSSRPQTPGSPASPISRGRMLNGDVVIMQSCERPPSELSATLPHSSPPCLRRKRRMPALRQRSTSHLRRRSSSSMSSCRRETATFISPPSSPRPNTSTTAPSPPASPRPKTARNIRFGSLSPGPVADEIPLGHPQRPLYTAIRKNMSRPESPTPSATSFDFHCQTLVYERGTRSLDIDASAARYGSLTRASQLAIAYTAARPALFAGTGAGFSVSGETEMRMDLARSRSMDGVPGDFAFREGKRNREGAGVKARVKSLGKTLKGFLPFKI